MGDALFLELALSVVVVLGFGYATGTFNDLAVIKVEESVEQPAQVLQLGAGEVFLADGDVGQDCRRGCWPRWADPCGAGRRAGVDELGGSLAMDGA